MSSNTLTSNEPIVNIQADLTIIIIRAFDKKGEWAIEVIFEDGITATRPATTEEVNATESRLYDLGWQVDASLFHRGWGAKPPIGDELIFASSAGMWPDDYATSPVTL